MNAGAIMTRDVVTVAPTTSVSQTAKIMVENRISAVPVVDHGDLVGIVTEHDLLRRAEIGTEHHRTRWVELMYSNASLAEEYVKEHGRKVGDVMTRDVITVEPTCPLVKVAEIFATRNIKRVPVVEDSLLVGIVSRANLVQALATGKAGLAKESLERDHEIKKALSEQARQQRWAFRPTDANVVVHNGEVHLWGFIGSEQERRAMIIMVENIPGVRRVEDHMEHPLVYPPM